MKLKKIIALMCCIVLHLCISSICTAQLFDTIKSDLKKKPVFHYKFDSRSAFIGNRSANVWGIKIGIGFNRRVRFGLGYNYLKSRLPSRVSLVSAQTGELLKTRLRMRYVSLYAEYVYYRKNKWELSVPVQFGIGNTTYVPFNDHEIYFKQITHPILLYEPCLSVNYRIVPFVAIGTEMGLRIALVKSRQIDEQITAPIYVFKAIIYWADMINYFWPNNKVPKPIMDIL